jgi:hypothetical protein
MLVLKTAVIHLKMSFGSGARCCSCITAFILFFVTGICVFLPIIVIYAVESGACNYKVKADVLSFDHVGPTQSSIKCDHELRWVIDGQMYSGQKRTYCEYMQRYDGDATDVVATIEGCYKTDRPSKFHVLKTGNP